MSGEIPGWLMVLINHLFSSGGVRPSEGRWGWGGGRGVRGTGEEGEGSRLSGRRGIRLLISIS